MDRISCARFLEILREDAPSFEELAHRQAIRLSSQDGIVQTDIYWDLISPAARRWLDSHPLNARELLSIWLRSQVVADGPKIFQPTLEQCLIMEQVAPRIATSDYAQPYPVMIVEFPEAFRQQRACCGQSALFVGTHAPEAVLIGFEPPPVGAIALEGLFSSGNVVRLGIMPRDATIEDRLVLEHGEESYAPTDPITVSEHVVIAGVMRVAINSMLLLAEYGCRHLGAANESHFRRLEHFAQLARRKKSGVDVAERNLRLASQFYGFAQEIVLHEEEARDAAAPRTEAHSESWRRPHWRRGHWKMHAHGPGLSARKRIFIKPVLVNRHLLHGDEALATTYKLR
jgi:hypothetical protein